MIFSMRVEEVSPWTHNRCITQGINTSVIVVYEMDLVIPLFLGS